MQVLWDNKKWNQMDRHFTLSMLKSGMRLIACYALWTTGDVTLQYAGIVLGLAELVGIAEEM